MTPPVSAVPSELTWSTTTYNRGYELKRNGEVVGTLRHPALFSSSYLAETIYGRWTFRRCGLLGASAQILDTTSQQQVATFRSVWGGGGILTFGEGETFHLECKGWSHPVWNITTGSGRIALSLHAREKTVELPVPAEVPEGRLYLLLMFTLYRVQQAEEDAASVAMVG